MQDGHTQLDAVQIRLGRLPEQIIGMKFDGLATRLGDDGRQQRLHAFLLQHTGRVVEQQGVDVRRHRQFVGLSRVIFVGMHRREREHDRTRHFRAELLGKLGQTLGLVVIEQDVVDPEAAHTVHVQLAHPGVHQGIGRDAEGHRGIGAHATADRCARHGLHQ